MLNWYIVTVLLCVVLFYPAMKAYMRYERTDFILNNLLLYISLSLFPVVNTVFLFMFIVFFVADFCIQGLGKKVIFKNKS